ncbi:MAG: hypothetical protein A2762_02810 [Candidatus Lloydbacteria bacterium RIFCSPHIGHO2_01_FULL_54_11]|nr:MAG: hypothetical protein A2762_02810 [Candidatus Lloydbacteria bacterium RIFCSPHIGHO2_01_FULL_54_11]
MDHTGADSFFVHKMAEAMSGTLNRKHGPNSRILIKAYVNCELCSSNILNGLRFQNLNQSKDKMPWIIRLNNNYTLVRTDKIFSDNYT